MRFLSDFPLNLGEAHRQECLTNLADILTVFHRLTSLSLFVCVLTASGQRGRSFRGLAVCAELTPDYVGSAAPPSDHLEEAVPSLLQRGGLGLTFQGGS